MNDPASPPSVESLLEHREWLRAVARTLVLDENVVDDVEQRTWMAVLRNRHRIESVRGWLRRVVRSAAVDERRVETRRHARERRAARAEASMPSTDHLVAQAEAQRAVAAAVTALPEPYRTTVLLRFFENLTPTEIATRSGVPVETVKTRLKRGLAVLRATLDREHGDDGRSWAVALLPLAGGREAALTSATTGGLAMAATMKTVTAAAVVGALLGSLVTAGAMSSRTAPPPVPLHGDPVTQASPPRSSDDADSAVRGGAQSRRASRPPDAAADDTSALAGWIDSVHIDVPRRGAGTITGHVLTQDGKPLAGVRVWAFPPRDPTERRWRRGRAQETPSVEEAARAAVEHAKWRAATTSEAETDASGAYLLTGLTDAAHRIGASADGWELRLVNVADSSNVRAGATVDFAASAVIDVPVTVLLPDGTTPDRAGVLWSASRGSMRAWWFRDDPFVVMDAGAWTLTAELGTDLRSPGIPVTLSVGAAPEPVTLQLAWRNVVEGAVRFAPEDAGWDYVQVTARRRDGRAAGRENTTSARPPGWQFRLEDLEPGEYELTASLDGSTPVATDTVHLSGGRLTHDLVVPRLSAAQFLTVRVLAPDGSALAADAFDLSLVEQRMGGGYGISGSRPVRQDDGSFRMLLRESKSAGERSDWFVRAKSKVWGQRDVRYVPGETRLVEVRFGEPAYFRPTVVGAEGAAFQGRLRVTLRPRAAEGPDLLGARDEAPDTAVEPGEYVAILWIAEERGPGGQVLARVPVRLARGENPLTIQVPPLQTLTVRIDDAQLGTQVWLSSARRPDRAAYTTSRKTSASGAVSFPHLPAGLFLVRVTLEGETRELIVRMPAEGEVTFVPTTIDGLAVTVDDRTGLLAAAGFESGDVIVAIDGTAIDTLGRADALLFAGRGHQRMEVEVARGRGRVTLVVDPARLELPGYRGGWWEPVLR